MGTVATGLKGMETQAGLVEKGADALGSSVHKLS
jgi:hypothetical protein